MQDVDWAAEGYEGRKLSYLGMQAGFWFDGHRAADDCQAGIAILDRVLPVSGRPALAALLENARQIRCRIWAENALMNTRTYCASVATGGMTVPMATRARGPSPWSKMPWRRNWLSFRLRYTATRWNCP